MYNGLIYENKNLMACCVYRGEENNSFNKVKRNFV